MIKWETTFPEQLRAMPDEELLEVYRKCSGEAGDPVCDALVEEIERRELDI